MVKCTGFPAIADANARVLILGTLPGSKSLEENQYYAKKANSFWKIMGHLIGVNTLPDLSYRERLEQLKKNNIALWDVCESAEREGSLDSDIIPETIVANNFAAFFKAHPQIELICFNGQPAERLFRKHVRGVSIRKEILPSTSPAHASKRPEQKLEEWRQILGEVIGATSQKREAC